MIPTTPSLSLMSYLNNYPTCGPPCSLSPSSLFCMVVLLARFSQFVLPMFLFVSFCLCPHGGSLLSFVEPWPAWLRLLPPPTVLKRLFLAHFSSHSHSISIFTDGSKSADGVGTPLWRCRYSIVTPLHPDCTYVSPASRDKHLLSWTLCNFVCSLSTAFL